MSSDQNLPEDSLTPPEVSPKGHEPVKGEAAPTSKKVTEPKPETSPKSAKPFAPAPQHPAEEHHLKVEDDEHLLEVEDDGDTFWLIQRVIWGILKSIMAIGFVGFLIWIVWGGYGPASKKRIEQVTEKKVEVPVTRPKKPIKKLVEKPISRPIKTELLSRRSDAIQAAGWNEWIENARLASFKTVLAESIAWTRDTEAFFEVPLPRMITGKTRTLRARKIENVLSEIWELLERSILIRQKLISQINEFSQLSEAEQQVTFVQETAFFDAIDNSDPTRISEFLTQKIDADKRQLEYSTQSEARTILLEKMGAYDEVLRNVHENITANRAALVEDIRVVEFPEDPFGRVQSLEEWREKIER